MNLKLIRYFTRIRFLRHGLRDRIARFIHNPDKAYNENFIVNFFGKKYIGNFSVYIDWSTYYFGAYAIEELEFMNRSLKNTEKSIVIDIGANIGHHSLFASTIAFQVHAFEPFPDVSKFILNKIEVNNLDNLILHKFGLGENEELLPYNPPIGCNTGTGSFVNPIKNGSEILLPIINGDSYFKSNVIKNISFIKIDVEGYESNVFKGLSNIITKDRPIVFFEWSNTSIEQSFNVKSCFPNDFYFFDFLGDKNIFYFFAIPGFRLKAFNGLIEGNKVAIPKEKAHDFINYIK